MLAAVIVRDEAARGELRAGRITLPSARWRSAFHRTEDSSENWRRWESNPRPRSREGGVYERIRRSDLVPRSPRRRGCGGPACW